MVSFRAFQGGSPVVRKTIDLNYKSKKKSSSLKWSLVNGALFLVFSYDLSCKCPSYTTYFHYAEYVLAWVFGLNLLYHTLRYLYLSCSMTPVTVTPYQKKLLGFTDLDTSFKIASEERSCSPSPNLDRSEPFSISSRSWMSNSSPNTSRQSIPSSSWAYRRGSPPSPLKNTSASMDFSTSEDFISDHHSLAKYLRLFEEKEALETLSASVEGESGAMWNAVPELQRIRPQYQLAPLTNTSSKKEEGSPGTLQGSPRDWWRLHLDPQQLTQWNLNLRLWIHMTILQRLVKEIKNIDEALQKHGLSDMKLGLVGRERLQQTSRMASVAQHVPTLPAILPFLEPFHNQEYVVQRIRELSNGGCLSEYRWNSGGTFHDKSWEDTLPTDSEIIMHLLATYMDTQLLPVTKNPDARPFSSQHMCRTPDKPPRGPGALLLYQCTSRPPHYVLVRDEEYIEVAKGHNNMIHTLLLFLHVVGTERHGMLGRVNLGRSGVNVLWVIGR